MPSNRIAVVTGATSGIGLGIATALAKQGINLVINGLGDPVTIQKNINYLESYGIKCLYVKCDLRKLHTIEEMIEKAVYTFDKIDILINNAGIQHVSKIEDFPANEWEQIIQVNLVASFYTTKFTVPHMKQQQYGRIINIASAHGLVASPFKSAYVAAKHGLVGFTKSIALELAEFGITANAICPGYVNTDLVQKQIANTAKVRGMAESEVLENVILKAHAIKQLIEVEDVANLALYLCGKSANLITGANFSIDAGWTAS